MLIKIFLVEDDPTFTKLVKAALKDNLQYDITAFTTAEECLNHIHENPDIVIIDYLLPDNSGLELMEKIDSYNNNIKKIIISGQTDVEVVVKSYKQGADDYIIKNENCLPELKNSLKNLADNISLQKEVEDLKAEIVDRNKYDKIVGNSPPILNVLKLIQKAEQTNILVLINGESGTGKELVARAIHYNSDRKKNPFVPVNMAAIPSELVESELFGHEKGAFTGAVNRRIGKFEEAHKGTIFLDEVGEMSLSMQVKLLRVIEDKQVVRVGSNKTIQLDVRILAATNKDLKQEVEEGNFREDLYYRLQGLIINLPPLRERGDDIILLARQFLQDFCKQNDLGDLSFSSKAIKKLLKHSWPGNVRELRNTVERAALLAESNIITPDDLNIDTSQDISDVINENLTLKDYKRNIIKAYLDKYENDVDKVAEKLDIGRATVYRQLKKMDVES